MDNVYLEINLQNFKKNVKVLKALLNKETKFMAVVKSNAYGHGIIECSKAAVEAGADWLGVVSLSEAIELRKHVKKPILVLGYVDKKDLELAARNDISIPVIDYDYAQEVAKKDFSKKLKIHLKIETGLSRLGFNVIKDGKLDLAILQKAITQLNQNKNIEIEGIYSHMAAVEEDPYRTYGQSDILADVASELKNLLGSPILHIASSAAAMTLPETHFDMTRFGIAIYGLWPSEKVKEAVEKSKKGLTLLPVLSFKTKIVHIKEIENNSAVGYGRIFRSKSPMKLAIIPVGYYEGLDRRLSNLGEVLIKGKRCPIIGRVCMNMTIVDISKVSNTAIDDEVVIIGRQDAEEITADEIAEKIGTINYEVIARIPLGIKRISID